MVNPTPNTSGLCKPWTSEEAREKGRKGGLNRKGAKWSWQQRAERMVRLKDQNGERTHDRVLRRLVELAEEGDPRAMELLFRVSGWRPETVKRHEHTVSRELVIRAKPATPIEPASAPELPQASDAPRPASEPTSDNA